MRASILGNLAALLVVWGNVSGLEAGPPRRGIDVNQTPPLELAWPFFDWTGTAEEFTVLNFWRSYHYAHEFHFWLRRDGGQRVKMVSRESTPFSGDWLFGPTYLPVEVDWSKKPEVRAVGVKLIDRGNRAFHDLSLPADTCTPLILFVKKDGKWVEWMVNNWFHDWHKYINPESEEEHPGLANVELAQYYIGKREPYDVFGHMNSISPDLYDDNLARILAAGQQGRIYHGFLVSDARAPRGYRIEFSHLWPAHPAGDAGLPVFGNPGTLRPHFVLPQTREWNFSEPPWPLTLTIETSKTDYLQNETIPLRITILNHADRPVKIAMPRGDPWPAFEIRSNRVNVSTRPPVTVFPIAEIKTLEPGGSLAALLNWHPYDYGYLKLSGKDVPLTAHYCAGYFCDAGKLQVFDQEIFSSRIHLRIDSRKAEKPAPVLPHVKPATK